jgi:hypothetical protein
MSFFFMASLDLASSRSEAVSVTKGLALYDFEGLDIRIRLVLVPATHLKFYLKFIEFIAVEE